LRKILPFVFILLAATSAKAEQSLAVFFLQQEASELRASPKRMARPEKLPSFIRGRLVCAANVNRLLEHRGKKGTGSNLAHSFAQWGRPSKIQPGAIQLEKRRNGGHVKVVSHHDGERWICLNPSARSQAWKFTNCGNKRVIGWRVS
jgi:hypothetical protein